MSGMVGVFSTDTPAPAAHLSAMAVALSHRGGVVASVETGSCAMARLDCSAAGGEPPFFFSGAGVGRSLLVDGYLLRPRTDPGRPAESLEALHRGEPPEKILPGLSGTLALALHDPSAKTLLLYRSWPGAVPLYYARLPGGLAFATEIRALLCLPPISVVPNERMLAQILLGEPDGRAGSTCFTGIESLAPGQAIRVGAGGIRAESMQALPLAGPFSPDPTDLAGQLREALGDAMRIDTAQDRIGFEVSGGLDSSSLFCLAARQEASAPDGARTGFFHHATGFPGADESAYVDHLRSPSLPGIRTIPTVVDGMAEALEDGVRRSEMPMAEGLFPTFEAIYGQAARSGCRYMVTGLFGDQVLCNLDYLESLALRGRWGTLRRHLQTLQAYNQDVPAGIYFRRILRSLAVRAVPVRLRPLLRRLSRRGSKGGPFAASLYRMGTDRRENPDRPWAGCGESAGSLCHLLQSVRFRLTLEHNDKVAARHGIRNHYPYLDPGVLSLVLRLPGSALHPGGIPKGLLREAVAGLVPDPIRQRTDKGDYTGVVQAVLARDLDRMIGKFFPGSAIARHGYAREEDLRRTLEQQRSDLDSDEATAAWGLFGILALEQWLRIFMP